MTGRRGFLGKLLGVGAVGMISLPKAEAIAPTIPPMDLTPPVARPPQEDRVLLLSVYKQHRIQIEIDRAIRFNDGRAWVTRHDADRLAKYFAGWDATIWMAGGERDRLLAQMSAKDLAAEARRMIGDR